MARFLSTKAHGAIDYLSAAMLVAGPRVLGWNPRLVSALDVLAGATVAYSLLTDYELGVLRILPLPAHFALDGANALTTLALPALPGIEDSRIAGCLVAVAVFETAVTVSTQTESSAKRGAPIPDGARM